MDKIKKNYKVSKIIKLFLIGLLSLSSFQLPNVKAMDNANVVTEGVSSWRMSSTDNSAWGQGMRIRIAGRVAYCIEPGVDLRYGESYIPSDDPMSVGITLDLADKISLIAYYGYGYKAQIHPDWEAITQGMIWHAMGDNRYFLTDTTPNYAILQSYWAIIQSHIDNHYTRPSFHGQNYELNVGESITITDTNNILNDMDIINTGGLNITKNGNQLIITATSLSDDNIMIRFEKADNQNSINGGDINVYWYNPVWQNISNFGLIDPVFANIRIRVNHNGELIPNKIDNETGNIAQGDATLQGAEYGLYALENTAYYTANQLVTTFVTGENGSVGTIGDLPLIKYYIKELVPSEGYLLDTTSYNFDLSTAPIDSTTGLRTLRLPLLQQVIKGKVQIFKTGHDGNMGLMLGLKDAEFTFKLHSDVLSVGWDDAKVYDIITTNTLGFATTIDLPYGTYQVRETKTPENHYNSDDFLVKITEDEEIIFKAVNNQPFKSWLKIIKTDDLGNTVTLNSATFKILDETGKEVSYKFGTETIDTFTTNQDGYVLLPEMLPYGKYTIVELNAPNGMLKSEDITVIIGMDNPNIVINEDNEPVIEVEVINEKPSLKLELRKIFEELEVAEELADASLAHFATFKISVVEDVIDPATGEIIYKAGQQIINEETTDGLFIIDNENEMIVIEDLSMGIGSIKLLIEEVETTLYHAIIEPIVIEIKQTDDTTIEYLYSVDIENYLTETYISKQDLTTQKELPNAHLKIEDLDGNLIEEWISTDRPYLIKGLERGKTYILTETLAPLGYELAQSIEFIINADGSTSTVVIYNELIPVVTGDNQSILMLVSFSIVCAVGVMFSIRKKRKDKK